MRWIVAAAMAASWALAGAAAAEQPSASVPIEPAPTSIGTAPSVPPPVVAPMPPDAGALSQIDPTAGPVAPHKAALKPAHKSLHHPLAASTNREQRRESKALNWLSAEGYGQFHDVRRIGHAYRATVDDPAGSYVVTVDPNTGRITPASVAANRTTRALNLLADRGYVQVSALRPAGTNFIATVTQHGRPVDVTVDPDRGQVTRGN
ncbi:MAG: hypothetical protein KGL11_05150 [Alphaproteobacteria bacterium]|nr:hypothetical protein [Alphaproteobacteria bacterium]